MNINFTGTIAVLNDSHNPFQDQRALREVELFLKELQPDMVIYAGDMSDFYALSKFDKNPARADKLQEDLNSTKESRFFLRSFSQFSRSSQMSDR